MKIFEHTQAHAQHSGIHTILTSQIELTAMILEPSKIEAHDRTQHLGSQQRGGEDWGKKKRVGNRDREPMQ